MRGQLLRKLKSGDHRAPLNPALVPFLTYFLRWLLVHREYNVTVSTTGCIPQGIHPVVEHVVCVPPLELLLAGSQLVIHDDAQVINDNGGEVP